MAQCSMDAMNEHHQGSPPRRYRKPAGVRSIEFARLLEDIGRPALEQRQFDLLRSGKSELPEEVVVYYSGDLDLLPRPCVSVVGTRDVSDTGRARTRRLARELVEAGIVIVSGLARGVDTEAMTTAIEHGNTV